MGEGPRNRAVGIVIADGLGGCMSGRASHLVEVAHGNAADWFIDRHVREGRGGRLAFADPFRQLTYAELQSGAARFVSILRDSGIQREQRIALLMLDTVDFPIAFWGALR